MTDERPETDKDSIISAIMKGASSESEMHD